MLNSVPNKVSSNASPQVNLKIQEAKDILKRISIENYRNLRAAFTRYAATRHFDDERGIQVEVGTEKLAIEFAKIFPKNVNDAITVFNEIQRTSTDFIYPEEAKAAREAIRKALQT